MPNYSRQREACHPPSMHDLPWGWGYMWLPANVLLPDSLLRGAFRHSGSIQGDASPRSPSKFLSSGHDSPNSLVLVSCPLSMPRHAHFPRKQMISTTVGLLPVSPWVLSCSTLGHFGA